CAGLCSGTRFLRVRYSLAHYKALVHFTATTSFPFFIKSRNHLEPLPSHCRVHAHSLNGPVNTFFRCRQHASPPAVPRKKAFAFGNLIMPAPYGVAIFKVAPETLYEKHPIEVGRLGDPLAAQHYDRCRATSGPGSGVSCSRPPAGITRFLTTGFN